MFRSGNRRSEAVVAAQPPKDNHPDQADSRVVDGGRGRGFAKNRDFTNRNGDLPSGNLT